MRTLAPGSPNYHGRCTVTSASATQLYHQGTVWPWLIGPFVLRLQRPKSAANTDAARKERRRLHRTLQGLHLLTTGLGSILRNRRLAAAPHPRPLPAEAWSVAEVLRVFWEDILNKSPAARPHAQQAKAAAVAV